MDTMESLLHRVMAEPAVFEDEKYIVVSDSEPVVAGHLLVFPKHAVESFADDSTEHLIALLDGPFRGYDFYERGRAPFCTSANGPRCAHAHLVPHGATPTPTFDAKLMRFATLREAYSAVSTQTQYLIWRCRNESACVITDAAALPKRAIRRALT